MTIPATWPRRTIATAVVLATALSPSFTTTPAAAQSTNPPTVPSMVPQAAAHSVYARIKAFDPLTREVTMDAADGSTLNVIAAPQVSLENLDIGDRVDAQYYRSVAFLVGKGSWTPSGQAINLPPEQAGFWRGTSKHRFPAA